MANVTQELSEIMGGENQAAFLEMHQVIKYVINTRSLGLKQEPKGSEKEPLEIVCFSDSDHAGDLVTKRSESGFALYILGFPVSF